MTTITRTALVAAAAIAVVVAGAILLPRWGGMGPGTVSPTPSASPSPSPSPLAYAWPRPLEAGTYSTNLRWSGDPRITFTVPDGWESRDIGVVKGDRMALQFFPIAGVFDDVCGEALRELGLQFGAQDVVDALTPLVSVDVDPRPAELGGRSWTYLEYTIGPELGCDPAEVRVFKLPDSGVCGEGCGGLGPPWKGLELDKPVEHDRLWLDTIGRGRTFAVAALWTPDASASELAELQRVIDSIRIDTPSATPLPVPASP